MFKAYHRQQERDVISLDPMLSREQLLGWAAADLLACPECGTDVGFRSGDLRRPHFFHRALVDCKYHPGEPEVMAARALLYDFLVRKAEALGGTVDIERRLPGMPDRELIDVWFQLPGKPPVAYRIFQRGPQPTRRRAVADLLKAEGAVTWEMLTASRLAVDANGINLDDDRVYVPAYDRHLCFSRSWDRFYHRRLEPAKTVSLMYLDPQEEQLVLLRGLWHPPECNLNVFEYVERLTAPLGEMKMLPDGELIFPHELPLKGHWEIWAAQEKQRLVEEAERQARLAEVSRKRLADEAQLQAQKHAAFQEQLNGRAQTQKFTATALAAVAGRSYQPGVSPADGNPFAREPSVWHELIRSEYTPLYSQPGASVRILDVAAMVAVRCGLKAEHFNFRDVAVFAAVQNFFEQEARSNPLRVRGSSVINTLGQ